MVCDFITMQRNPSRLLMLGFWVFLGLLELDFVDSYPLKSDPSGESVSWSLYVGIGLAVGGCLVLVLAACTCCGEQLLNLKGDQPRGSSSGVQADRHDSLEPPASIPSTPGSVRRTEEPHSVTIEPLPDVSNIHRTSSGSAPIIPRPIGFNHAVNKGINTQDWFQDCSVPDFPRAQLQYVKEISSGWFGHVVEGRISANDASKRRLAVKILRDDASTMERAYFLHEARLNRDVSHPNVLPLVAKCLDTESYLLILEYFNTDLKEYLWKSRAVSEELIHNGRLLHIPSQISSGLSFIHDRGFVYNDLSCRNCVILNDGSVKIGDYGVSTQKYKDDYLISGDIAVPVRWLAPEVIEVAPDGKLITKELTQASNVWTYGVVLWEILEFAKLPYMDLSTDEVLESVVKKDGSVRLLQPLTPIPHSDHLYEIMRFCWMSQELRPPMAKVHAMVTYVQENREPMADFDMRWNSLLPKQSGPQPNDMASPVPADPGSESVAVVEPVIPISMTSPSEPIPPVPAPRLKHVAEKPAIVEENILLEHVSASKEVTETRPDTEVRRFEESETERKEKREFVLSLNDEELGGFDLEQLVQFYEFLTMDEIKALEARYYAVVQRRNEEMENQRKRDCFLAMDIGEMGQLPPDELEQYLNLLDPHKREEISTGVADYRERTKFLMLVREGDPEELMRLTAADLDRAADTLDSKELLQLQNSISEAQKRLEWRNIAISLRDGPDSHLATLSEEKLEEYLAELSDTDAQTLKGRWKEASESRARARNEILSAEGLHLYLLSLKGLDRYFCHLNDDEIRVVTERLNEVQKMRQNLLDTEREGFVDLADENLSFWLTEEETVSIRARREEAVWMKEKRKEILDAEGMNLYRMYKEQWDEFIPIISAEERSGIQEKINLIEEERSRLADLSNEGLGEMRPEDIEFLSQYFDDQEFDRIRIRWEEARIQRDNRRNQVLSCSDEDLILLSNSDGLESYRSILGDDEWITVVERLDSAEKKLMEARKNILDIAEEDMWKIQSDAQMVEAKVVLSEGEFAQFLLIRQRSMDRRNEVQKQLLLSDDKTFLELAEGWTGLDSYRPFLTEDEWMQVGSRFAKLKLEAEKERERFLNISDSELFGLREEDVALAKARLSEPEFTLLKSRLDSALELRRMKQEEIRNVPDLGLLRLAETGELEGFRQFISETEFSGLNGRVIALQTERQRIRNSSPAALATGNCGTVDRWREIFERDEASRLMLKYSEAMEAREGILSLPDEGLLQLPPGRLEGYYRFLTEEEREAMENRVFHCTEKKTGFQSLSDPELLRLSSGELESLFLLLTEEETEDMKRRIQRARDAEKPLHVIKDATGEAVSPIPLRAVKKIQDALEDEERKSTSTPEDASKPSLKNRRLASESLEPLETPMVGSEMTDPLVLSGLPPCVGTPAMKREYDESRDRILNLTDADLKKMPLAEIENSYRFLSPEEILEMQERVRKLQQIEDVWSLSEMDLSSSIRGSMKRRSRPLISELSMQSKSFLSNMSSISVFYLDDNIEDANPLDARELILNAEDDALLQVPLDKLSEYYNYLTLEEIQDTQHRLTEAKELKRAELLGASREELNSMDPNKLHLFLSVIPEEDTEKIRQTMAEEPAGITEEPPPAELLPPSSDLADVLGKSDSVDFLKTIAETSLTLGMETEDEDRERMDDGGILGEKTLVREVLQSAGGDVENLEEIPADFLDKFGESAGAVTPEPESIARHDISDGSELLLDFGFQGSDRTPEPGSHLGQDFTSEVSEDLLGLDNPVTVSTPTKTRDQEASEMSVVSPQSTTYHTALQDLLGDFDTPQTSMMDTSEEKTPGEEMRKKNQDPLAEIRGKATDVEETLSSTFTPVKPTIGDND